ncbi:uncharacterized protein SPAPADRAFT_61450 [Spathaspora passalidarum NRRL Y-27907]|uniref:Uncharacterized protein n=1 Tax=Spathaspora passalidarum (strain NRRL Y-27907 / 11-Y1) TaxID=619300 RepID=G3AMV8_SPAPN|nr:uncharacterized protein SPAPADRAFT_61450 [Spathaspora passalidarum NRRL Y-27907]EGW32372.1 hypothetical protein SPAPADRAFT_61450 [Spathaspora passalidarum NRRL Y-27907]
MAFSSSLSSVFPISEVQRFLSRQQRSLQRLLLGVKLDFGFVLDSFDEICKPVPGFENDHLMYESILGNLLKGDELRYPQLRHVVIDRYHYKIEGNSYKQINYEI